MVDEKKEIEFEANVGQGMEELGSQDFQMPLLSILQANSPELQEGNEKYNPEARPGRIFSAKSGICYREVHLIPIRMKVRNVEWKPREAGGGKIADYGVTNTPKDIHQDAATGRLFRSNGNQIVQTYYYLCMLQEEAWDKVILSLKSTQNKQARRWNTIMQAQKLVMYSYIYKLSVISQNNPKGTWYGWKVDWDSQLTDLQLYNQAKEAHQAMIDFLPKQMIDFLDNGGNGDSAGSEEVL